MVNRKRKQSPPGKAQPSGDEELRLQVFLARCGVGSRRACEEHILHGRVKVNGKVVDKMGIKVGQDDRVEFDHKRVYPDRRFAYIALYKPKFVVSSLNDPEGRSTVADIVKGRFPFRLFHVGRLDYLSTGLMFLTNDGDFSSYITNPANGVEKEYLVELSRPIGEELLDSFVRGVSIDGERFAIDSYHLTGERSVSMVLTEGKNREIRRLFHHHKIRVKRLHRVRIGAIRLRKMSPGEYRILNKRDLESLGYKPEGTIWS